MEKQEDQGRRESQTPAAKLSTPKVCLLQMQTGSLMRNVLNQVCHHPAPFKL